MNILGWGQPVLLQWNYPNLQCLFPTSFNGIKHSVTHVHSHQALQMVKKFYRTNVYKIVVETSRTCYWGSNKIVAHTAKDCLRVQKLFVLDFHPLGYALVTWFCISSTSSTIRQKKDFKRKKCSSEFPTTGNLHPKVNRKVYYVFLFTLDSTLSVHDCIKRANRCGWVGRSWIYNYNARQFLYEIYSNPLCLQLFTVTQDFNSTSSTK